MSLTREACSCLAKIQYVGLLKREGPFTALNKWFESLNDQAQSSTVFSRDVVACANALFLYEKKRKSMQQTACDGLMEERQESHPFFTETWDSESWDLRQTRKHIYRLSCYMRLRWSDFEAVLHIWCWIWELLEVIFCYINFNFSSRKMNRGLLKMLWQLVRDFDKN